MDGDVQSQQTGATSCCPCPEGCCCCSKGYKWFIQVIIFLAFILFIISFSITLSEPMIFIFLATMFFAVVYLVYTIMACNSNTCAYLRNIKGCGNVCNYMERLFYTPGNFMLNAECYHYEITFSKKGRLSRKRVVTYRETQSFPYVSWRDISGPFNLDTSGVSQENKSLLKLRLNKSLELANDGTIQDYNYFKDCMTFRLQYVDECFNLTEYTFIPGFDDKTLVQMADQVPCIATVGCFTCCFLLIFGEFYKLCFNNNCSFQEFTLRKINSSTQDLNANMQSQEYLAQAPKIILKGMEYNFHDTNKFLAKPADLDTPVDQRREGPQAHQGGVDQKDIENNNQIPAMPVRANYDGQMGNPPMNMNMQMGTLQMINPFPNMQMNTSPQINFNPLMNIQMVNPMRNPQMNMNMGMGNYQPNLQPIYGNNMHTYGSNNLQYAILPTNNNNMNRNQGYNLQLKNENTYGYNG